ncbi:hypothetical protein B566_EDAN010217 [Ephemera danica]|nr:hypothetical protein B566_EDAN010217 [Ephemera danica]
MQLVTAALGFFVLLSCNGVLQAQRPSFGRCPRVGSGKTLDLDKMKGRWYEVERSFYIYELNRRCIKMDMTPEGKGIRITTKAVSRTSDSPVSDSAVATPKSTGSAQMRLVVDTDFSRRLPGGLRRVLPGNGDYVVLKTDYDTYAIVYSCSDLGILHADLIWVLARTQDLPVTKRLEIYNALEREGLGGSDRLTLTSHRDCPSDH